MTKRYTGGIPERSRVDGVRSGVGGVGRVVGVRGGSLPGGLLVSARKDVSRIKTSS